MLNMLSKCLTRAKVLLIGLFGEETHALLNRGYDLPLVGLVFGLICGLIGGLIGGLARGFTDRVTVGKASPNQGIKLSRKNALGASFIIFLSVGLLPVGLFVGSPGGRLVGLVFGLICGLVFGLSGGLNRGGSAVIKHYALRLILYLTGSTPFNFIKFLDHCAKLILLKKVGGGYIFIHRMLLEYFADPTPESITAGDTTTGLK